jgi:hypothetical protein
MSVKRLTWLEEILGRSCVGDGLLGILTEI